MPTFVFIDYRVRDFEIWKEAFDEHQAVREGLGAARHWLYTGAEDGGEIFVALEVDDLDQARALVDDPALSAAMTEAGAEIERVSFREEHEVVDY